jgi:hypothetical protein
MRAIWDGPDDVFPALSGHWLLTRTIDTGAAFIGRADFVTLRDDRLDYHEYGELQLPDGQRLVGERRYVFTKHDGGFAVHFAETPLRLFHCVELSRVGPSLVGEATHRCGDDRYDGCYEFGADETFVIRHAVHGPRKRYDITTRYERRAVDMALAAPAA